MIPIQDSTPRRCPPVMTYSLIALNGLVFLMETTLPQRLLQDFFYLFGVVPALATHAFFSGDIAVTGHVLVSLFTCMFVHGGWIHIIGNMWTLWIFGDNVEDAMGPGRFLLFYLTSGICASLIHVAMNPLSQLPIVGASGAIAGVMGAYYVLYPRARIVLLFPILFIPFFFEVPAVFYLAIWFLQQLFSGTLSLAAPFSSGGVAWWAHVGGFVFGMLFHRLFLLGRLRQCRRYADEYRTWGMFFPDDRW